jgi:hypothetical protein
MRRGGTVIRTDDGLWRVSRSVVKRIEAGRSDPLQALHRTNLIREARASCSLDGDTQSEGDSYVLISEDRLKRYESELAALREKVRRLEGAEAENASLD